MKKKAFTLVELLVVIAIIAMLLAILMPALSRVRQLAFQMICATNQSGVGKAILLYSNENEEKYPEYGPGGDTYTSWANSMGTPYEWGVRTFPQDDEPPDAYVTVTCSLYLLVKYADVSPSQFLCSAHKATKFELDDYENDLPSDDPAKDITECWDFGPKPARHVSFAYNYPYWRTSPDGSSPPAVPLMADLSPWMKIGLADLTEFEPAKPESGDLAPQLVDYSEEENKAKFKLGNSPNHNLEGQNVLFNDMHVNFMKTPNIGVEQDNIYTRWSGDPAEEEIDDEMRQKGERIDDFIENAGGDCDDCPKDEGDAILVQW